MAINGAIQNVTLMDQTFVWPSASTMFSTNINTQGYQWIKVLLWQKAIAGAGAALQADVLAILPDGSVVDFYNNGTHQFTFSYDIGPGMGQAFMAPPIMQISMTLTGTSPTATYRVLVIGYN